MIVGVSVGRGVSVMVKVAVGKFVSVAVAVKVKVGVKVRVGRGVEVAVGAAKGEPKLHPASRIKSKAYQLRSTHEGLFLNTNPFLFEAN